MFVKAYRHSFLFDKTYITAHIVENNEIVARGLSDISYGQALAIAIDCYICDLLEEKGLSFKPYSEITRP